MTKLFANEPDVFDQRIIDLAKRHGISYFVAVDVARLLAEAEKAGRRRGYTEAARDVAEAAIMTAPKRMPTAKRKKGKAR
jgi:hypothetical protein